MALARRLRLEHSDGVLRLDVKRLLPVADTLQGPIPMNRMGSGKNWLGYHLITHLAIHKQFVARTRPVPRFILLDQPSQVYFPADKDVDGSVAGLADEDRDAVVRMYKLIFDVVESLQLKFQVIVTEHADLAVDPRYQAAIVEKWRGGLALVPDDWDPERVPPATPGVPPAPADGAT